MTALFGTDGIRGIAGRPPLDSPTLRALATALVEVLLDQPPPRRVLIGRDTRLSGGWIERLLVSELEGSGIEVSLAKVISTPALAFLVGWWKFTAGIMISASHNPAHYNGIKIFSAQGTKLDDLLEERIEGRIAELTRRFKPEDYHPSHSPTDPLIEERSIVNPYLDHLRESIGIRLDGLRLVVDNAHGSNWRLAPHLFQEQNAHVWLLGSSPDGNNINDDCGALHPDAMSRAVLENGTDAGICFDGDGDRVIMADEQGQVVDGDQILYLFAKYLKPASDSRIIVGTVMSNLGLEVVLKKCGFSLLRAPVGDRYVYEQMVERGSEIGGEQSGHIILRRFASTGDGLLTALQVLAIMRREQAPLSALLANFRRFPQVLVNVHVARKPLLEQLDSIQQLIDCARSNLGQESRILVRYSGTEPLVRVMIEGQEQQSINKEAQRIAEALKSLLNP